MRAILTLIRTYFTATPLMRGLVSLGLVCAAVGMTGYLYYPTFTLGTGMRSSPLWFQSAVLVGPWLGLILIFFASSLLPVIMERLAGGRLIMILPGAQVRLLLSAIVTAGLIAGLTALGGVLAFFYYATDMKPERIFSRTLLVVFADISVMYVALWIVSKARGIWLLTGSLLIALGIVLPLGLIGRPSGVPSLIWVGVFGWLAFALWLLFGARLRHTLGRSLLAPQALARRMSPSIEYQAGAELDLLLGTSQSWIVALGQVVPVVGAAWFIRQPIVWLFYLTLFSAISGAVTSTAAARSRVLWLRFGWTRSEILRRVEAAYWRYNAYSLGVLLALFVVIGSYLEFNTPLLALGMVLLVLGSVVSANLGLMLSRGLRWPEAILGVVTTGLLLATAAAAVDTEAGIARAVALEAVLAALALCYRVIAKTRWNDLDWMVCRNPVGARGAG